MAKLKYTGKMPSPDGNQTFKFEIGFPEESFTAPYLCHVLLVIENNNEIIVDSPVYGEDAFQALHSATSLINKLSGWELAMNNLQQPPKVK